jgi:uncharacterized protein (DUF2062 family)
MPGSAHRVAAGLACGAAVSVTPFVGVHFILAGVFALAIGGSVIASLIGTFLLNPWTAPFIWWGSFQVGQWILRLLFGWPGVDGGEFLEFFAALGTAVLTFDRDLFIREVWPVLLPMLTGSLPLAVIAWIVVYWPARRLIRRYQRRRFERRIARSLINDGVVTESKAPAGNYLGPDAAAD